jgi:rhombotail lipoprotein
VHNASSLVQFLYPNGDVPRQDDMPELHVPLRVGLAFLPPGVGGAALDGAHKEALLSQIRARFISRKFIAEIVIIPEYYLTGAKGYQGLEAVERLYGVDLMALVSYDQVAHSGDNNLSLAYLTVVGAYIVDGTRNEVSTLIDLAVVDPKTRTLVIRSGGTNMRMSNSTLVSRDTELRRQQDDGFSAATDQLIEHFDAALGKFESDVHEGRANVRVAQRNGAGAEAGGGGAIDGLVLALLATLSLSSAARSALIRSRARPSQFSPLPREQGRNAPSEFAGSLHHGDGEGQFGADTGQVAEGDQTNLLDADAGRHEECQMARSLRHAFKHQCNG